MSASLEEGGVYNIYSLVCHRESCHCLRGANGRYYAPVQSWTEAKRLGLRPCVNCRPFFLPTGAPFSAQNAEPDAEERIAANDRRIAELQQQIEAAKQAEQAQLPAADVIEWRRRIAQALSRLDQTTDRPPNEGIAARISRLSRSGVIPRQVANMMLTITEMRNAVEYNAKQLSQGENIVAWANWHAIQEWASQDGLQM